MTDRHAERQADRQTDRQADRGTNRQPGRQKGRQMDRQPGRQTGRQADRQTDRQADRQADRQTGRQTGRQAATQHSKVQRGYWIAVGSQPLIGRTTWLLSAQQQICETGFRQTAPGLIYTTSLPGLGPAVTVSSTPYRFHTTSLHLRSITMALNVCATVQITHT